MPCLSNNKFKSAAFAALNIGYLTYSFMDSLFPYH